MHGSNHISEDLSVLSGSTGRGAQMAEGRTMFYSSVAEQIEKSKSHWSLLAEFDSDDEDAEVAEVSNVQVFKALQQHPRWGDFFLDFNLGHGWSTLEVGEKFAEGGQAELYEAHVNWGKPFKNEWDLEHGREWVLKVFKKGTFLRQLQSQWPRELLQFHAEERMNWKSPTPKRYPKFWCEVYRGTLLKDGRFAFLMIKEHFDLRNLIEHNMGLRSQKDYGPFPKEDATYIMYLIALGMEWLHSLGIVHRDLKAANVLMKEFESGHPRWTCYIADYECSIGVVGTGFFRAPEILQACQEQKLYQRPEVFSKASDAYSYGMTCYEILTGKLPFEGHSQNDYDLVINGQRPTIPDYVDNWTRELLTRCWQSNPSARSTFREILDLLIENSVEAREHEEDLKMKYGENFRLDFQILAQH